MGVWDTLREFVEGHYLNEETMYRGETGIRLKDVEALFDALRNGGPKGEVYTTDPQVLNGAPNAEGGCVQARYPVDSRIWSRWSANPTLAATMGTTKDDSNPGASRGGTVMKRQHGGRVFFSPGRPSTGHERQPSAMDRYDMMMSGEVSGGSIPKFAKTDFHGKSQGEVGGYAKTGGGILVQRIAWSPAIGSTEERQARLQQLLGVRSGAVAPLRRRPQGELPQPSKDDAERAAGQRPADVPRQGGAGRLGMGNFPNGKRGED